MEEEFGEGDVEVPSGSEEARCRGRRLGVVRDGSWPDPRDRPSSPPGVHEGDAPATVRGPASDDRRAFEDGEGPPDGSSGESSVPGDDAVIEPACVVRLDRVMCDGRGGESGLGGEVESRIGDDGGGRGAASLARVGRGGGPKRRTKNEDPFAGSSRRCMMSRKRSFAAQGEKGRTNCPAVHTRRHRIKVTAWSCHAPGRFGFCALSSSLHEGWDARGSCCDSSGPALLNF